MATQYIGGDTSPTLVVDVDANVAIVAGDLVYLSSGKAIPAASVTWDTNLATTQTAAHDIFLGVALTSKPAGEAGRVTIASRGEFEFDCAAAQFAIGALVAPAKASGNNLENQIVVGGVAAALACGRVTRHYGSNTTTVRVWIQGIVLDGSQALA